MDVRRNDPSRDKRKRDTERAAIKQIMGEEEPPAWAQQLLIQINSIKTSFESRFDELSDSIKGLKKDTKAVLNRMNNAETRIGELEDQGQGRGLSEKQDDTVGNPQ